MGQESSLSCGAYCDDISVAHSTKSDHESQEDVIIRDWAESRRLEALPSEKYQKQMAFVMQGFESWLRQGLALVNYPKLGVLDIIGLACAAAGSLTERTNALCSEHPIQRRIAVQEIWAAHPQLGNQLPPALLDAVIRYMSLIAVFKANYHSSQEEITSKEIDACTDAYYEINRVKKVSLISQWIKQRLRCPVATFYAFMTPEKLLQLGDTPAESQEKNRSDVPFVFEMIDEPEDFIRRDTKRGGLTLYSVGFMFSGESSEATIGFVEVAAAAPLTNADVWTADCIIREFGSVLENVSRKSLDAYADHAADNSVLHLSDLPLK
eukprot:GEMP01028106.1.p1 GENE.GEMP01028106.1~~GEMP01028106.1.p1  ORF type:complete len:333 (+),score=50.45 GEMP01028106.1:33-1001(+)